MAIKASGIGGGALTLNDVSGSDGSVQRGLPQRGTQVSLGSLPIYNPYSPTSPMYRPSCKFSSNGIAVIQFLYDFSAIPHTVSGPGGILATPCSYSIGGIPGNSSYTGNGQLLHFSNVADFSRTSPHFSTPSVPIPRIQSVIDEATAMARRLAGVINPMSRHVMAGLIII